jgi:CheY-like chemotaxis protein
MSIDSNRHTSSTPPPGEGAPEVRKLVHDLRNVVAPLSNAVQLLRFRGKTDAQLSPIADIIERQVNEMVRMLNALAGAAAPSAPPAGGHASVIAAAASRRRILIVDDNVALLTSLSSVLREAGHLVRTAEDGTQALVAAESWQPEIVLLDAAMPGMNGFEVAKQLRAAYSREAMTLVLMSGSTLDEATRRGAERAGFDHCVDKIQSSTWLDSMLRSWA